MPDTAALYNAALPLFQAGQYVQAASLLHQALTVDNQHAESHFLLGAVYEQTGQIQAAMNAYQLVHSLRPTWPGPCTALGNLLRQLGRTDEAITMHRRAVETQPAFVPGWINLGTALESQRQFDGALGAYARAIKLDPQQPMAWYNRGVSLAALGRSQQAADAYRQSIAFQPDFPPAHNNLGSMLEKLGQSDAAIACYRHALALQPDYPQALNNLGSALHLAGEFDESLATFRRALQFHPRFALAHSNLLYLLLFHPDATPEMLRQEHARWNDLHALPLAPALPKHTNDRSPMRRLRIGYVSPDFRDHVVARNLLPIFRHHDRDQIELFLYSNSTRADATTGEFKKLATWRDIATLSDEAAATLIQNDCIDILIDCSLHMAGNRLQLFARKPAPVQLTFAGYPGTTGLTAIDYRLTDPHLDPPLPPGIPDPADQHYSEKSLRLPHTFWVYDPLGLNVPISDLPALANNHITFGCLNNFCKLNIPTLARWSTVLRALPTSRLLLLAHQGAHRDRTLHTLSTHGISPDRITFSPLLPCEDYLRLYHGIDIALDTLPYNGHTTTLDALWMGVPVVTQVGNTVAGRAAFSQLTNIGLPELIAHSADDFTRIAVTLAQNLPRLSNLRQTLRSRLESSPVMDAPALARALESSFRNTWQTWCAH